MDLCVKASPMLIIHCGRLKKPLRRSAFKFSTLEVKPQYKLAKYAWQCSCTVGDQIYMERKKEKCCSWMWCRRFTASSRDSMSFGKNKTRTTAIQMYSNSLLSPSIHWYKPFVYKLFSGGVNTKSQSLASFTIHFFFFFLFCFTDDSA